MKKKKPQQILRPEFVALKFKGIEKQCISVTIEGKEYDDCAEAAKNFWASSKKSQYGVGLGNARNDNQKVERTGFLGETAFAKLIDEPVDFEYKKFGDKEDFLILGKYKIDVKCAMSNYGQNFLIKTDARGREQLFEKDFYVGSFVLSDDRENKKAEIVLTGFYSLKELLNCSIEPGKRGGHINYIMPFHKTRPILSLIEIIKNIKNRNEKKV
jgi:hypothetical protein